MIEDTVSGDVATKDKPMAKLPATQRGYKWRMFTVSKETFDKFVEGKKKFERWSKYLNLKNDVECEMYMYAKASPTNTIVLKCNESGKLRAIKRGSALTMPI